MAANRQVKRQVLERLVSRNAAKNTGFPPPATPEVMPLPEFSVGAPKMIPTSSGRRRVVMPESPLESTSATPVMDQMSQQNHLRRLIQEQAREMLKSLEKF